MEKVITEPVQLSKGFKLKDVMSSMTEFHIDMDFKRRDRFDLLEDEPDLIVDSEEDSDIEEAMLKMENSAEQIALSCPEYHMFEELAANMVDCVASGDAKILIIEEGEGPLIPVDAEVSIHYAAYWEKASHPFDTTLTRNQGLPITVNLGRNEIIPGLEMGLTSVRGPAAKVHMLLQPAVTWGQMGALPRLPAAPALFVVVVYDVRDVQAAARFNDLPTQEQSKHEVTLRTVASIHAEAKKLFAKHKFKRAIKNYQQAISVISLSNSETDEQYAEVKRLRVNSYVNLMVCYYKIEKPKYIMGVYENLDNIIDVEKHCKALFYCGRAYELLNKTDRAVEYYKKALKLEPKNRDIGRALTDLDSKLKMAAQKERNMCQKIFKTESRVEYKVDADFENGVKEMLADLSGCDDYTKYDLPVGLSDDEVTCVKVLVGSFRNVKVLEEGAGRTRKIALFKRNVD